MNSPQQIWKTRLAPTPSGYLHLGNALSFALTAGIAEHMGAKTLLRIDDLDRQRVEEKYVMDIFDTLEFLGIPHHEGPDNYPEYLSRYSQIHRTGLYNSALKDLREKGTIFACTCSRTQVPNGIYPGTCRNKHIPLDHPDVNWRLRTNETALTVHTLRGEKITATLPPEMQDFVIRKKDGFPAYQLASLVDDHFFGINLIIRGEDLWPSTLAQLYLAEVLDYQPFRNAVFHHHPLLLTGNRKLSKSAGDTSIGFLCKAGKTPEEVYGMIAQMLGIATPVSGCSSLTRAVIPWLS
ncbi:glutamate--tRNA ligase family protein [Chitinophaga sp. XS-30]|uniref:glutamate--tRNA ligase family protein n=1 Tax=Chitinophaga sp. XS-30 TaxID=2604421 RepID=UPI0011DE523C|nr:glutamate--tRNA ligase family protein [Chitinophaga sp. XS-30]QEH39353.1 tRNA glutamyl-Q synthetase [Chitinophaga sp. XS-30]